MLYVIDRAGNAVAVLSHYYNDEHKQDITAGASSLEFDINKNERGTEFLATGNSILKIDSAKRPWSFTIMSAESTHSKIHVQAFDAGIELINRALPEWPTTDAHDFKYYFDQITADTPWKLGINQLAGLSRKLVYTGRDTGLGRLLSILTGFDNAEAKFVITLKNTHVVDYKVDVYRKIGYNQTNIQIVYSNELNDITKTESRAQFVTALSGIGAVIQPDTSATTTTDATAPEVHVDFSDIEYKDADFSSPKGDKFIHAVTANHEFNETRGYIEDYYDYDTSSPQELFNRTLAQLKIRSEPSFTYSADVKKIDPTLNLGDYVTIIDHDYNPALYLRARVATLTKSETDPTKNSVEFSNYQVLKSSLAQRLNNLQQVVNALPTNATINILNKDIGNALDAANDAKQQVILAMTAANGKSTIYYDARPSNAQEGDTAFMTNADGSVEIWGFHNGAWSLTVGDATGEEVKKQVSDAMAETEVAKQQANDAVAKANQAVANAGFASGAAGQAKTAAANAQADAANALGKASQSVDDATAAKGQAANALGQANTAINDAANALDKFNNISIGGTNLLTDSGFESGNVPANYAWGDGKLEDRILSVNERPNETYPSPMGKFMLQVGNYSTDSVTRVDQYAYYPITPVFIKKGETWTYSYYYASAGSATGQASDYLMTDAISPIFEMSMGHDLRETSGGQTTWHRFVKTWKADRDVTVTTLRFGFVKTSANVGGWICIDNIKLEHGNIVTDWSAAPEDVQQQFTNIDGELASKVSQTTYNVLSGTVDTVNTLAKQNQSTISTLATKTSVDTVNKTATTAQTLAQQNENALKLKADSSTVSSLDGRVTKLSGQLDVQSGLISAKVTANDVTGMLNGYATQTWSQGKLDLTADSLTSQISSVQNGLNEKYTSLEQTLSGVQATANNAVTQAQLTLLSDQFTSKIGPIDLTAGTVSSQITQLQSDINLRVKTGDLVSQIDVNAKRILLDGASTYITNTTHIDNGIIKNAMIADATISGAKIVNASIMDAKIATLDGSKITANSITADKLSVTTLLVGLNAGLSSINITPYTISFTPGGSFASLSIDSSGVLFNDVTTGERMGKLEASPFNVSKDVWYNGISVSLDNQADFLHLGHMEADGKTMTTKLIWSASKVADFGHEVGFNFFDTTTFNSSVVLRNNIYADWGGPAIYATNYNASGFSFVNSAGAGIVWGTKGHIYIVNGWKYYDATNFVK
ncbi:hypothetical protein [Loigolactobacillus backii]|uniref:hypothetical protein n=1 Tax=Loigolactobacillus backii TaxID=375175 RepID=UPI0022FD3CFC|nr:hypothetical protein [Loigolactobacillus backii]MDA5386949.1 hypothetical protein [Loigolactobacillus backii]MDA5389487.1 hypothetical protein [Loigolactobacillus backii]